MECCVNALVTSFKETILAECPGMIKRNETESEYAGRPTSQRVQQPDDAPSFPSDHCTRDHTRDHTATFCLLFPQLPVLTLWKSFNLKYDS